jgi:hypothetical protein
VPGKTKVASQRCFAAKIAEEFPDAGHLPNRFKTSVILAFG